MIISLMLKSILTTSYSHQTMLNVFRYVIHTENMTQIGRKIDARMIYVWLPNR